MAFDGTTIAAVRKELSDSILGGRIYKIAQPEPDELLITIKTPEGQRKLYISASASLPLIYLTDENKPSPMTAPGFCMLLRKYVGNGRITAISQPGLERILFFDIEHLNELGDLCRKRLIVEIMGKHSNIIFCDDKDKILDSIKHVSAQMSSVREVLPGRTYFIPDTMSKLDPLTVSFKNFVLALREKPAALGKAIYTSFTGISPVVAEHIVSESGLDTDIPASDISEDMLIHLYRQFSYYIEDLKEGNFHPVIYYSNEVPKEFTAIPFSHYGNYRAECFDSISRVLRTYYATRNTVTRIRQKSADLRHVVQTNLERARKKYDLQSKQLQGTEGREKYKVYGELINTYGYNLDPEAKSLTCLNYYTNEDITIPLDPQKTPQENAQKYFAKYNKQKRTFEALSELIQETADEILYLESVSNSLDIALSEADLGQIKEELTASGYVRRKFTKKKEKQKMVSRFIAIAERYNSQTGYREVLMHRRPDKGLLRGLWEYPGVDASSPEEMKAAFAAEMGLDIIPEGRLLETEHVFTHRHWKMQVYQVKLLKGPAESEESFCWASVDRQTELMIPTAFRKIQEFLAEPEQLRLI